MSDEKKDKIDSPILVSHHGHFEEIVWDALGQRNMRSSDIVTTYLAKMLEHYMLTDNFYLACEETGKRKVETLAEMWFQAEQTEPPKKWDLLKRLGDISLSVSGLFGDSLKRKVVDVDYYANVGGTAYLSLANSGSDGLSEVYDEFGRRFLEYVDVLTVISEKSSMQVGGDLLRLYDRFVVTGSKKAEEDLLKKGLLTNPDMKKKASQ